jgi:hypothetical protein
MNTKIVIGAILTLAGFIGVIYSCVGALNNHIQQNPFAGIIMVAVFALYTGAMFLRRAAEET